MQRNNKKNLNFRLREEIKRTVLNANRTNLPVHASKTPSENRQNRKFSAQQRMQSTYRPNLSLPANRTHPQNRQTRENQTAPENQASPVSPFLRQLLQRPLNNSASNKT